MCGKDILSQMSQPNQCELIESILSILGIVDRTSGNRPEQIAVLEQELTAHTNAEIAKVLDRLEIEMPSKRNTLVGDAYQRTFCNEYNKALKEVSKVIQAERAKLKEVK